MPKKVLVTGYHNLDNLILKGLTLILIKIMANTVSLVSLTVNCGIKYRLPN